MFITQILTMPLIHRHGPPARLHRIASLWTFPTEARGRHRAGGDLAMKLDLAQMSARLASDATITDYEFWRAIKLLDDELYRAERSGRPIPMQLIYARQALRTAHACRLRRRRE